MAPQAEKPKSPSKNSWVWLALTGLFLTVGVISFLFPPEVPQNQAAGLPVFDLQGHRGARGLYPENTIPGFEGALALGVTTLEMDVGLTRDGVLVVHHDTRLNPERTRSPGGAWIEPPAPALHELTYAELAAFDVGAIRPNTRLAAKFPNQTDLTGVGIPALAQVLARAEAVSRGTVRCNIETKISPEAPNDTAGPEAFADALTAAVRQAGVVGRVTVQSFDWCTLKHVQATAPEIATVYLTAERDWLDNLKRGQPGASPWTAGLDVDDFDGSAPRAVREAGGRVWSPYFRDLRESDLAEARRMGLKVVVWTVNDPAHMASLIELGVDGIITEYPDRARRVMADKGMALPPAFSGAR